MALTEDEADIRSRLAGQIGRDRRELERFDAYFDGAQRLEQMGLAVPADLQRFVVVVQWPSTVVKALEERSDLEGFRLAGQAEADDELWRIWQENDLDEESQLCHLEALALKRAIICVGTNEDDENTPLTTVESPLEMAVELDPRWRKERYAYREYKRPGEGRAGTLYLPDVTIQLEQRRGKWVDVDRDEHGLGTPPVVLLANEPRLKKRQGFSRMSRAISATDAAMRMLTNSGLAGELLAAPMRYVLGATKGDFVDKDGKPITAWEVYLGHFLALANQDAKIGQLPGADLKNFTEIVNHFGQHIAGTYGLPMRYLGQATTNPPSADGIRADEARLIKDTERFNKVAGGKWERWARITRRMVDGDWDPRLKSMEVMWRDPATPTRAQQADATVKLYQAGILPLEAAWEDLGYSAVRRQKLREQIAAERSDPVLSLLKGSTDPAAAGSDAGAGDGGAAADREGDLADAGVS